MTGRGDWKVDGGRCARRSGHARRGRTSEWTVKARRMAATRASDKPNREGGRARREEEETHLTYVRAR